MKVSWKAVFPLFAALVLGLMIPAASADPMLPQKSQHQTNGSGVLVGHLLKIEGEIYVVKDAGGKEVRLHVGKNAALDARIKVGDKIEAQMGADGQAVTVLKAME